MKKEHVFAEVAERFDDFWKVYPKRRGDANKWKARQIFNRLLKNGASSEAIVAAARGYADECAKSKRVGTEYVAMATTWLNQHRWEDHEGKSPDQVQIGDVMRGYVWNGSRWAETT